MTPPRVRAFPISPRGLRDLEVGDLWTVRLPTGDLGLLQVHDLIRNGPGARTAFVVGVVDWRGSAPPAPADLRGRRVLAIGLTDVRAVTRSGTQIIGNESLPYVGVLAHPLRDLAVGTTTAVWGCDALPRVALELLETRR